MYDPSVEADWKGTIPNGTEEVFIPTISELIEACGDRFKPLARYGDDWCTDLCVGDKFERWASKGKTPEEAVAKLWLALNKYEDTHHIPT